MEERKDYEISKEMEKRYDQVFGYEPDIEESLKKFSPEFDSEIDKMLENLVNGTNEQD